MHGHFYIGWHICMSSSKWPKAIFNTLIIIYRTCDDLGGGGGGGGGQNKMGNLDCG